MKNIKKFDGFHIVNNKAQGFDEVFDALGYRQGFDEFIEDNPGAVEALLEWIVTIPEFANKLRKQNIDILDGYLYESKNTNEEHKTISVI